MPAILAQRLQGGEPGIVAGDILVVTQKIVSKAEGRIVDPAGVEPSPEARALAAEVGKDAVQVELVLRESTGIVRTGPNVLIARHRLGCVMANAGIDASNVGSERGGKVILLPEDPDASAARIAQACYDRAGQRPAVVISDSFGRPWRVGTVNVAIGIAGLPGVIDQRGQPDRDGRTMQVTQIAFADSVAAAAGLAMGEGAEGLPACVVRGLSWEGESQGSQSLLRSEGEDLFR